MILLAKAALGIGSTLVLAGAYTFHEGVIRIDVDESRAGGCHVHLWAPAAMVPMAMHLVPREHMQEVSEHMQEVSEHTREFLPTAHAIMKELKKFPDADLVEVINEDQHVQIRTRHGKLQIDVEDSSQTVHLLCPLSTLDDVTSQIESSVTGF